MPCHAVCACHGARGWEKNSGGGCHKTPEFDHERTAEALLEPAQTLHPSCACFKAATDAIAGNGGRATGGIGGGRGERTGNRLDRCPANALKELRHLDASPSLISISQARLFRSSRFFVWGLSRALGPRSVPSEWLRLRSGFSKGSQVTALTINRN